MWWTYDDERWDDEITPGYTFKDARREFSRLVPLNNYVEVTTLDERRLNNIKKACAARHEHEQAAPINFRPVSEEEAAKRFSPSSAQYMEYVQLYPADEDGNPIFRGGEWPWEQEGYQGFKPPLKEDNRPWYKGQMIPITLFYMWDGTGWGMSPSYWGGKMMYFRFGCEHEWGTPPEGSEAKKRRLYRCEHLYYCVKCEHWRVVDSSD